MYKNMLSIGEHKYSGSTFCCRSFIVDTKKPIVVSFHFAQKIPSKNDFNGNKDNIFGFNFLKSNLVNVISFSPLDKNTWYRDNEIVEFMKEITRFMDVFPIRCGYGSSMGGFAVGAFSKLLNLDRILLLNPISTLDNNKAPFEKRFKSIQTDWKGEFTDACESSTEGVIIYDPLCKEDRMHAIRFKNNIKLIPLIGAGHNVPKLLLDMKVIKQLVLTFIKNGEVITNFKKRRDCLFYYNNLIKNKKITDSRARIVNAHKALVEYNDNSKYIAAFTNKELYELEKAALKLASINEYKLALNIIKNLLKIKSTSKRYKHLFISWTSLID